ncbi:MAG: CHAT domain-containing protein [Chloroflexales bacterium]
MPTPPILRLTQTASQDNRHTIELEWLEGSARQTASAIVELTMSEQDQRDLAWYVEEYAEYPFEPHPQRAARIEARLHDVGVELFNKLFAANNPTRRMWFEAARRLSDVRVEIVTDAEGATALPWELLRDPDTDTVLALHAQAFVRAAPAVPRPPLALEPQAIIRILLVICRPSGGDDVPFRSVASRLLKSLSAEARAVFQLEVLRPPTFAQLAKVLSDAKSAGKPYHVVHFDGHGVYGSPDLLPVDMSKITYRVAGPQGFLLFESDTTTNRRELVHGTRLGELLVQTNVPLLVLNACRSAHAAPAEADDAQPDADTAAPAVDEDDPNAKVRAFGSLAQQVMLTGVGGVVAMRYNVYVVTAAQFVAELYRALVQGRSLGEAVSRGRKDLHAQPVREIVQKLTLQDWLVPVVYEAQATQVFQPATTAHALPITIKRANATPQRGDLDSALPPTPDVGFFGRDETLLALDRGFDRHHIVLLHAFAGSGKTTTAAEFARWYALTGGVNGPVLWSSFEQPKKLSQVLDQLGLLFNASLQQSGLDWHTITEIAEKRDLALQILRQVPVLWVWDNIEPVAGFPAGSPSHWTAAEQRELADFLRAVRDTPAKFLLTSRRDEQAWLGNLPLRIVLPPMPMHERRQMAEALAAKYNVTLNQDDWRPLLVYSGGNPLTMTVAMGQALRDGLRTASQIKAYVDKLRAGEAGFDDDENEGRSRSLGASLSYGFANTFTAQEQATLALLHHFQGFVWVDVLVTMGNPQLPGHLPELAGFTREQGVALLDRAAEIGLLTAHGGGYYSIHPALPWFLRRLYEEHYGKPNPNPKSEIKNPQSPARAYVEAMGELSNYYTAQYEGGNRGVIAMLRAEEANLLHARRSALRHGWYDAIIMAMQGLHQLYAHTGRRAEWRTLVEEIVPSFVDPTSDGPLPGREEQWELVTEYRMRLLREERQWADAAKLQGLQVDYQRQQAAPLLALPPEQLDAGQRNSLRSLAASLHELGQIQREEGAATCVGNYQESYDLSLRIGEQAGAAVCAFNLGHAYKDIPALRDLAQAETWYRRSLEMRAEGDNLYKGTSLGQLGLVAYERFNEARQAGEPAAVLVEHLNNALRAYQEALDMMPPDEVQTRAIIHNALGVIYKNAGQTEQAVAHYRESIRYEEQQGNLYGAASTRQNVAIAYANAGRFADALLFAQAAQRNFVQFGPAAAQAAAKVQGLIARIEEAMRKGNE